jgi:hypothetical protein
MMKTVINYKLIWFYDLVSIILVSTYINLLTSEKMAKTIGEISINKTMLYITSLGFIFVFALLLTKFRECYNEVLTDETKKDFDVAFWKRLVAEKKFFSPRLFLLLFFTGFFIILFWFKH